MIYIILGMSLLFIGIGFLVTEKNAKYLLSGYNTMSEEERKKVDLKNYIPYFKKFHIFLGLSFGVMGLLLNFLIGENAAGIFLGVYPILAYIFFIWKSSDFSKAQSLKSNRAAILILIGILIFISGLFFYGFKENELIFNENQIEISGIYGQTLPLENIAEIRLLDHLPKITLKSNGFALGSIRKGYFKTADGEKVLLMLNSEAEPMIFIQTKSNEKIYFSAKEKSNEAIFKTLQTKLSTNK